MGKSTRRSDEPIDYISESVKKAVSKESILGEIMLGLRDTTDKQYKSSNYKYTHTANKYKDSAHHLKYCKDCNLVWEFQYGHIGSVRSRTKAVYHTDFPRYKLARKRCPSC